MSFIVLETEAVRLSDSVSTRIQAPDYFLKSYLWKKKVGVGFIKFTMSTLNDSVQRVKWKASNQEKIFAKYIAEERLAVQLFKKPVKLCNKEQTHPNK